MSQIVENAYLDLDPDLIKSSFSVSGKILLWSCWQTERQAHAR